MCVQGKVIAWDPPRKFAVTWQVEWPVEFAKLPECHVTYEIAPAGDAVPDNDGISFLERAGGDPVRRPHGLASGAIGPQELARAGTAPVIKMQPPKEMIEAIKNLKL